jgi:uncharacterized protein
MTLLEAHPRAIADRVLDEESSRRRHLVVALSGAHAYGFPSPDSDLDLKAVHVAPLEAFLGLDEPEPVADRLEVIEGVEIDYTSNEIGRVLSGVLSGNGNFLERILGCTVQPAVTLRADPGLRALRPICRAALSRRVHHHYRGFARSQLIAFEKAAEASTKKALYVIRTALTGIHLLLTGEMVIDVRALLDDHGFGDARALVERKRAGERVTLEATDRDRWLTRLATLLDALDDARARSPLPEEPRDARALHAWLVAERLSERR